jgi:hypothetical protein
MGIDGKVPCCVRLIPAEALRMPEVRCANKEVRFNPWERIRAVGGVNPDGQRWKLTQEAAVAAIEHHTYGDFYVNSPAGHRVRVVVATSYFGHKYLTTQSDGEQPNNLLSLPECP